MTDTVPEIKYGVSTPARIAGKTGRQRLQTIVGGKLPRPPIGQGRQIISAAARVLSRDGKVLAHGTSTLMVPGGAK